MPLRTLTRNRLKTRNDDHTDLGHRDRAALPWEPRLGGGRGHCRIGLCIETGSRNELGSEMNCPVASRGGSQKSWLVGRSNLPPQALSGCFRVIGVIVVPFGPFPRFEWLLPQQYACPTVVTAQANWLPSVTLWNDWPPTTCCGGEMDTLAYGDGHHCRATPAFTRSGDGRCADCSARDKHQTWRRPSRSPGRWSSTRPGGR